MANRGRNHIANESRDFNETRRYGEDTTYPDERPEYRTQASRARSRPHFSMTDAEWDYSTRRHPPEERSSVGRNYSSSNFHYVGNAREGFFGKGPKGYRRSDERIKEEVCEALYRDKHVDASEIEVDVKEGLVTLSGTVDSRQMKRGAEECIEHLAGVTDVHNRIRIMERGDVSHLRSGQEPATDSYS